MNKNLTADELFAKNEKKLIVSALAVTELKLHAVMDTARSWGKNWEKTSGKKLEEKNLIKVLLAKVAKKSNAEFINVIVKRNKAERDVAYQKVLKRLSDSLKKDVEKNPEKYGLTN